MIFRDAPCIESRKNRLEEAYRVLDKYLQERNPWVTGKTMTIADFSIASTVSTALVNNGSSLRINKSFLQSEFNTFVTFASRSYKTAGRLLHSTSR